jgi:hypothetical protein
MTSEELMVGILVDHKGGDVSKPLRSACVHVCLLNSPLGSRSDLITGERKESKQFARSDIGTSFSSVVPCTSSGQIKNLQHPL